MRIALLIANGYGMGGTIRTVFNIAYGLAERHDVEIVSVVQHRRQPFFDPPSGVPLRALVASRNWRNRPPQSLLTRVLERVPSPHMPPAEVRGRGEVFNVHTERELRAFLRGTDADVVIGTRPGLNLSLARWAPQRVLTIGQEHVLLENHRESSRTQFRFWYPRLDGLTVLTEADRAAYQELLPIEPGWLTTMPNPLPPGCRPRSRLDNPIIAAVGRLAPVKQFDKLLAAFAVVARQHPEWRLRIYGSGQDEAPLRAAITEAGLHNQVAIMGRTRDVVGELAKASILAVSSRSEGFGMTLIEAFSAGVPVVSFDCPHGPREIITHGQNGLLVPQQDVEALADGLLRLVRSADERRRMGTAAWEAARRYELGAVTERWEKFLSERMAARRPTRRRALSSR